MGWLIIGGCAIITVIVLVIGASLCVMSKRFSRQEEAAARKAAGR